MEVCFGADGAETLGKMYSGCLGGKPSTRIRSTKPTRRFRFKLIVFWMEGYVLELGW